MQAARDRAMAIALALALPAALAVVHVLATRGSGTLGAGVLDVVAVTPRTTISEAHRHLLAGFFHRSWGHWAFNSALIAGAYPAASRLGRLTPWAAGYAVSFPTVPIVHLALVLPLAAAGLPYAHRALDLPLVGSSVAAYAMLGVALCAARIRLPARVALAAAIVAFEATVGLWGITTPFVWVYHLAGLAGGVALGIALLERRGNAACGAGAAVQARTPK